MRTISRIFPLKFMPSWISSLAGTGTTIRIVEYSSTKTACLWHVVLIAIVAVASHQPVHASIVSIPTFTDWSISSHAVPNCGGLLDCSVSGLGTSAVSWSDGGDSLFFTGRTVATNTLPPTPYLLDLGTISFHNGSSTGVAGSFTLTVDLYDTTTSQILETMVTTVEIVTRIDSIHGSDADSIRWQLASCCYKDMTVGEGGSQISTVLGSSGSLNLFDIVYLSGDGIVSDPSDPFTPVAPRPVPIPPALWLFGSGLLGLVGVSRRRQIKKKSYLLGVLCVASVTLNAPANAAIVTVEMTNVSGNLWEHIYTVTNDTASASIASLLITYDSYTQEPESGTSTAPDTWSPLVTNTLLEFDPELGSYFPIENPSYEATTTGPGIGIGATLSGFSVFVYEFEDPTSIYYHAPFFEVYDATGNLLDANALAITAVPLPAAIWLFGSGILGLIGLTRRKQAE